MKTLLKVLNKDLKSPYQGFQFELGKKYHCKDFYDSIELEFAEGFYAVNYDGLICVYYIGQKVFEVQVSGKEAECNIYKRRYENIKIIREIPLEELVETAKDLWDKKLGYKLSEALNPINPFEIDPPKINCDIISLFKKAIEIHKHVNVFKSIIDTMWEERSGKELKESVLLHCLKSSMEGNLYKIIEHLPCYTYIERRKFTYDIFPSSINSAIAGYFTSLLPPRRWKYYKYENGVNPFQPIVDLWRIGFVPFANDQNWLIISKNGIEYKQRKADAVAYKEFPF